MTSVERKATPAWREFEKLVARIEQTLAGSNVTVTSADRFANLSIERTHNGATTTGQQQQQQGTDHGFPLPCCGRPAKIVKNAGGVSAPLSQ